MVEIMNDVSYSNVREMVKHCLCEVQSKTANIGVSGIPSGFESLDELTDGFKKGKVYIVGGRPCMGKEEFVLSMIRNIVVESKVPALLFSTNKYPNNTLSESIKKEFISIPIKNESNITNEKKELFEGSKNDNNSAKSLEKSKKYYI